MAYAVVQHTSGSGTTTGLTTGKTLPGAPTAGNWLIVSVCLQDGATTTQTFCPINTTDWFLVDDALLAGSGTGGGDNANNIVRVIARKVQPGDTATMPAFCISGSSFFAYTVVEISGGSGTWATDFHSARNNCNVTSAAAIVSPNDTSLVANTFGLAFAAGYNESADGSFSAGWTADENTHNTSNYGSYGVAHQAFATAGTTISATFTKASSSNARGKAIVTVLLTPSQPTTPHIKRHRSWNNPTGVTGTPGSILMGGDPANGSLLVVFLGWKDGTAAAPTVSGSWTNYANALNGSNPMVLGLYRYASSDTRTWPALCSAGNQLWVAEAVEIGGVTGTFATDHASSKNGYQASGTSLVTTADTTTAANQLVTNGIFNFSTAVANFSPSGTDLLDSGFSAGNYGAWAQSEKYIASSGTAVQTTWTVPQSNPAAYIQDIWGAGAPVSVNITGAAAAGAPHALTPSIAANLTGVSAAGAPGTVTPSFNQSVAIAGAAATGAPGSVIGGHDGSGAVVGAHAAMQMPIAGGGLTPEISVTLSGVFCAGAPGSVTDAFPPFTDFPVFSIMRNTAVPAIGVVSDEAVALIGKLPASGPEPVSVAVSITGVSASAQRAQLGYTRNVRAPLVGVASAALAALVVPT